MTMPQERSTWTRLVLRELYDLGYDQAAACLEREAAVQLQSPAMQRLQRFVLAQQWDQAIQLLQPADKSDSSDGNNQDMESGDATSKAGCKAASGIRMASRDALREASLLLLKRKYLSLVRNKQVQAALAMFQREIQPAYELSEDEISELGMLLLCRGPEDGLVMEEAVPWMKKDVLASIEQLVSQDEIVPAGALRRLVQNGNQEEVDARSLAQATSVSAECVAVLLKHTQDVWNLAFSPDGSLLASCSRDGALIIWKLDFQEAIFRQATIVFMLQAAESAAECIAWSPDSRFLLSCSKGSDLIQLWDIATGTCEHHFRHPADSVLNVQWLPSGSQFVSGSSDKSLVLWNADDGSIEYQWSGRRVLDMAMHPHRNQVFVLIAGAEIRVYDLDTKSDVTFFKSEHLISTIAISSDGRFVLANFIQQEKIACMEISTETIVANYRGIQEKRYIIQPSFCGYYDELVASGSEDAKLYLWNRENGNLLAAVDGHSSVINAVQRHPIHGHLLATASDDETVRVWMLKKDE